MTKHQRTASITLSVLRFLGTCAFWVLVWFVCATLYGKPFLFPKPAAVFKAFIVLLKDPLLYKSVGNSLLHVLLALCIGALVGILGGAAVARSKTVDALISPAFSVMRATPVVCFILLAWVFLGSELLPAFVASVMTAPVMLTATAGAIREVDPRLLEVARTYHLSFFKRLRAIYIPSVLPTVRMTLVTCIGLAWKSCIATEMISLTQNTAGYEIWLSKTWYMDYPTMFAWMIVIVSISILFEKVAKLLLTPKKRGVS